MILSGSRPRLATESRGLTHTAGHRPLHLKVKQTQEVEAEAIRLMLHHIPIIVAKVKRSDYSKHTWRHSSGPKLVNRKGGKRRKLRRSRRKKTKCEKYDVPCWLKSRQTILIANLISSYGYQALVYGRATITPCTGVHL